MGFDLQIAYSVDEIGQQAWDRLGAGRPFASYRWYRFGETVLKGDAPIYVVLSQEEEPLARGTFWLKRQEPLPVASRTVRRLLEATLRRWPLMVCRVPLASTSGLILPEPPLRDFALKTIVEVARDTASRQGASFLLFDYLQDRDTSWAGWPHDFAPATVPDPGTRLIVAWPDFESYLKDQRKSVRKDYRRHRNRAAELGVAIRCNSTVTAVEEALVLIRNVEKHHNSPPNPRARAVLENASMVDATWLTAEIGERLVGCGLVLRDADSCFLALLGLDYSVRYAYFQLVYAAIRSVIEGGYRFLRGGGGAYDMKQRLGFQLGDDNHVVFAGSRWMFQRLGTWVAAFADARQSDCHGS